MKENLLEIELPVKKKLKFPSLPKKKNFLSQKERLGAFIFFNALGYILQIGSYKNFYDSLFDENPGHFAFIYSLGNVLSLIGTFIYCGIKEQIRVMTDVDRRFVSFVFLGTLGFSLVVPFFWEGRIAKYVIGLAILVQMVSYWFYTLSFFPGLKKFIMSFFRYFSCFKKK